jgi:hypothetical protein
MQLSRRPAKAGLIVAAIVAALTAALLTFAQPASALGKHCVTDPFVGGTQGVCLITDGAGGFATAQILATSGSFHSPTVALEMCSVGPSNCGTVAARNDVGHIWPDATHDNFFETSKPYSPGHIYRAIGSWIDQAGTHHVAISTGYFT